MIKLQTQPNPYANQCTPNPCVNHCKPSPTHVSHDLTYTHGTETSID